MFYGIKNASETDHRDVTYVFIIVLLTEVVWEHLHFGYRAVRRRVVRSRKVSKPRDWVLNHSVVLKFDRRFCISAAETPVKLQNDQTNL